MRDADVNDYGHNQARKCFVLEETAQFGHTTFSAESARGRELEGEYIARPRSGKLISASLNRSARDAISCSADRLRFVIVGIGMYHEGRTVGVQK